MKPLKPSSFQLFATCRYYRQCLRADDIARWHKTWHVESNQERSYISIL